MSIIAGPGFGKSTLPCAAWSAPVPAGARQVWLSCEPTDESADHLRSGLAAALGLPAETGTAAVLEEIWLHNPDAVCLVFDDAHEIPAGSGGARWLELVATELSANAHLVFSSRQGSPIPLARVVAAGEVIRLGERELLFNDEESAAFAASRGIDPVLLASTEGWPALAELTASA